MNRVSLFLAGFLGQRVGDWIYLVALNWLVLERTDSALSLALINGCRLLPALVLSLPAGFLADRLERVGLLRLVSTAVAFLTPFLGWLVAEQFPLGLALVVLLVRESLLCMEPPIRNALVAELTPNDLSRTLALQSSTMNLGRIVGPVVGGLLVSYGTPLTPFLVAWVLLLLQPLVLARLSLTLPASKGLSRQAPRSSLGPELRHNQRLRYLLALAVPAMLFGFPYTAMMPLFARDLHHQGADGLGLYLSLAALGALLGSLWQTREDSGLNLVGWLALFGLGLFVFVCSTSPAPVGLGLLLVGFAGQGYRTRSRILLQTSVPSELHGRAVGLSLMDRGLIPIGTAGLAWIAVGLGPLAAGLAMSGGLIITTYLLFKSPLRPSSHNR